MKEGSKSRFLRTLIAAVIVQCAICPVGLKGQTGTADRRAVLLKVLTAMGTPAGFLGNSTATGHIAYADGRTGTVALRTLGASLLQSSTTIDGVSQTVTINDNGAVLDKNGKNSQLPIWFAESRIVEVLPVVSIGAWIQRPDLTITEMPSGDNSSDNLRRFHVQKITDGTLQGDADQQIYDFIVSVDPVTLTIRGVRAKWFDFNRLESYMPVDISYSDYRMVNGMMIPFDISYSSDGTFMSEIKMDSVDVRSNNTLADFN